MPHEVIIEAIAGIAEVGIEAASDSKDKKSGCGCLVIMIIVIGCLVAFYFYA